jgi:outer membrane receptor protein involved in Fe transport
MRRIVGTLFHIRTHNMIHFFIALLLFCSAATSQIFAQAPTPGRVYGIVIDAGNSQPLEYATIVLRNMKDSTTTGGLTDEKGRFSIESVKLGMYHLEITYLGYNTYTQQMLKVVPPTQVLNLGTLKLTESSAELETITIVGEKNMFQLGAEKKVFNVEKNAMAAGGTAIEALKQIPTVDVSLQGEISMRGSENVLILINGKPSGLTGSSRQAILESLPANSIESIEIINNPSAKYDADGTAGIINIVLKKNYNRGLNGNVTVGYATKFKNNAGLGLNFKKNKINFSSNFGYRYWETFWYGDDERKNIGSNFTNFINTYDYTRRFNTSANANINLDIEIDDKSTLSIANVLSLGRGNSTTDGEISFLDADKVFYGGFFRDTDSRSKNFNNDVFINYKRNLKQQGQSLELSGNYNYGSFVTPQNFVQRDIDADFNPVFLVDLRESTDRANANQTGVFQIDYLHPFQKHGKLEAGYKTTIRDIFSDFKADSLNRNTGETDVNANLTNAYRYFENVNAAYLTFGGQHKKFSYKAGLRVEQTNININNTQVEGDFDRHYVDFFPSVFMSQRLPKNHELQLSYSRRINRPSPWMLNPFADFSNPLNIFVGNPNLNPEYINAVEMTWVKNWNAIFITATTYYRHNADVFSRIRVVDSLTSVATLTWANLQTGINIGEEIIFRAPITKWWNVLANVNLFQNIIRGDIPGGDNDLSNNSFLWNFRVQTGFKFWKNTDLQLSYRYNSKMIFLQGFIRPMQNLDIAVRKEIMNKKGSIALNVQDLFNTRLFYVESSGSNFESVADRRWETRMFTATFTYKFGKTETSGNNMRRRPMQQMDDGGGMMNF